MTLVSSSMWTTVSIHAAREGRDHDQHGFNGIAARVSIHAAREGRDLITQCARKCIAGFNPRGP